MITIDHHMGEGKDDLVDPALIPEFTDIITADPQLTVILSWLPLYADTELPILLTGEPGTGKELVAKAIFALGPARRRPHQRLNCAALTESLVSSELFGHVRGAFTGADQARPGKFRLAHGGSLFLDEVGELPLAIQPKLLRAVEQGEIEPVGGDAVVKVDVRLVAASNQDLLGLVAQGRFRQDLYDRLAVLAIHLPPLRERSGDILLLAAHFVRKAARRYGRNQSLGFSGGARRRLEQQPWPGNVRELRNVVTRAVLFSTGNLIREEDLAFNQLPSLPTQPSPALGEGMPASRPSAAQLKALLNSERGNVSALSRRLQVCSKTIYRGARSHDIDLMGIRG
jgi:two-component system response regulator HydG